MDSKLEQILNILQTKEIHSISRGSSANSSPQKRCRFDAEVEKEIVLEKEIEVVYSTAAVNQSNSESFFGGKIRSAVPSSTITDAHTTLSTSFVNHYKNEDQFLPTKEKNRRKRCIAFMKTLLKNEEKLFLSSQMPSPADREYSKWRNQLDIVANTLQDRAMIKLLHLEGKDSSKRYKLQPTIPAVDKRLTSIGERKWSCNMETSMASTLVLENFMNNK